MYVNDATGTSTAGEPGGGAAFGHHRFAITCCPPVGGTATVPANAFPPNNCVYAYFCPFVAVSCHSGATVTSVPAHSCHVIEFGSHVNSAVSGFTPAGSSNCEPVSSVCPAGTPWVIADVVSW